MLSSCFLADRNDNARLQVLGLASKSWREFSRIGSKHTFKRFFVMESISAFSLARAADSAAALALAADSTSAALCEGTQFLRVMTARLYLCVEMHIQS